MKYSGAFIYATISFMRAVDQEIGLLEEKADAMLDALDPAIKRQMLFAMIKGDVTGSMTVHAVLGVQSRQKINAIKAVRGSTGYGLKEAKDIIDECETQGRSTIPGEWEPSVRAQLKHELTGTGYEMLY
jgi:ribosomal protein L7/L12